MRRRLLPFACGALFALGLTLAGQLQPGVLMRAFRPFADFDPRLYLLFAGALLVHVPLSAWVRRRGRALDGSAPSFSCRTRVDARLVLGSLLFGIGWGLGGICPGPAVVAAATFTPHAVAFLVGLTAGLALHALLHEHAARSADDVSDPSTRKPRWLPRSPPRPGRNSSS